MMSPERVPISDQDPSIPDFRYSENEREELRKIMTDQEIDEKEKLIRSRQAHKKIEEEREEK